MSFRVSLFLLLGSWAALYLPALGEPELRGEEIRRIIPAQEMLETGDWVVPRIAGEVYANKPPLINWAVAAAFALTGAQTETSARMVSALSLLALALAALLLLRKDRGNEAAVLVALALLTTLTLIAKGRLIEIEALYTALTGIACFWWWRFWRDQGSPWLIWLPPSFFLGLACLVKGPVHLLFWFPFVLATLRFAREERRLLHPAFFAGLLVTVALVLPWVLLNIREVGAGEASVGHWVEELAIRGDVSKMEWSRWLTNPFKIPGGFLPWTIPLLYALWHLRKNRFSLERGRREDALIAGALFALISGYVLICLLPGGVPRYLMPVYPLAALVTMELYFRLPSAPRQGYERFGFRVNGVLAAGLLIAPAALAVATAREGAEAPWIWIGVGWLATALVIGLVATRWRHRSTLFHTALLVAAGGIGLLPAMQPHQGEDDLFRKASLDLASLAPEDGGIVVYADAEFRNRLTKHLRLLYYLREPVAGIGENGAIPPGTALVIGRPECREAIRVKLGNRRIAGERAVAIRGVTLLALAIDEGSSDARDQ